MTTEPKLLTEAEWLAWMQKPQSTEKALTDLRERGLIAEEPVDRLMKKAVELVDLWLPDETELRHEAIDLALAALRCGMELAPRKELTREMVRKIYNGTKPFSPTDEAHITRIHAALTEALQ